MPLSLQRSAITQLSRSHTGRSKPCEHFFRSSLSRTTLTLYLLVDPVFRKNLLIQCKILLQILDIKITAYEKRYQEFTKDDRRMFSKTEDLLNQTAKQVKISEAKCNLQEVLSKIVFIEKRWIEWKNKGCQHSPTDAVASETTQTLEKR